MASQRSPIGTAIRLAVACLVVGFVLTTLGATPLAVLTWLTDAARSLWALSRGALGWAGPYILLGALIVLPLALLRFLWRRLTVKGRG